MIQLRICGNCGQYNQIAFEDNKPVKCRGCEVVAFLRDDPDEGTAKHFIPSHFFERGNFEVWAAKSYNGGAPIVLIAANLSLATAKSFSWPYKQIRQNGKVIA